MESNEFEIGYTDSNQEKMVFFIPIKKLVDDKENGTALFRGKMDEFRGIVLLKIQEMRQKKVREGVLIPPNGSQRPPLSVA